MAVRIDEDQHVSFVLCLHMLGTAGLRGSAVVIGVAISGVFDAQCVCETLQLGARYACPIHWAGHVESVFWQLKSNRAPKCVVRPKVVVIDCCSFT